MLKQVGSIIITGGNIQPPSGGCVLKLLLGGRNGAFVNQPPSGGCVLKHIAAECADEFAVQPPSGGCVLKR